MKRLKYLKRWTRALLCYVLLGAIVTVAVAWCFAIWGGVGSFDALRTATERRRNAAIADQLGLTLDEQALVAVFSGTGLEIVADLPIRAPRAWEVRCGWPVSALRGWRDKATTRFAIEVPWTVVIEPGGTVKRLLPLAPCWPGFAADTAVFAALTALAALVAGAVRRRWRRHRGRCPDCGYDLQGIGGTTCPECGPRPAGPDAVTASGQ